MDQTGNSAEGMNRSVRAQKKRIESHEHGGEDLPEPMDMSETTTVDTLLDVIDFLFSLAVFYFNPHVHSRFFTASCRTRSDIYIQTEAGLVLSRLSKHTVWGPVVKEKLLPIYLSCVSEMRVEGQVEGGEMGVNARHSMDTIRQCAMAQFLTAATVLVPGNTLSWYAHMRVGQCGSGRLWTCSIDRECGKAYKRVFYWPTEIESSNFFRYSDELRDMSERDADKVLGPVEAMYSLDGVDCQPRRSGSVYDKSAALAWRSTMFDWYAHGERKSAAKHAEEPVSDAEIELAKPVIEYLSVLMKVNPVEWSVGEIFLSFPFSSNIYIYTYIETERAIILR